MGPSICREEMKWRAALAKCVWGESLANSAAGFGSGLNDICLAVARKPRGSSVFTLVWRGGQKDVDNYYPASAWRSCWMLIHRKIHQLCCVIKELGVYLKCSSRSAACAGKRMSGSLVKRKKKCCNEFNQWKKNRAWFDKLTWTLLTVKLLIYGWANAQVFSLDA